MLGIAWTWWLLLLFFAASGVTVYCFRERLETRFGLIEGPILGAIIKFSIPLLISIIFQQFYNVVDAMVVGNYVGSNAVTVVGQSGQVFLFLTALVMGLAMGIGILVAQKFGARDEEALKKIMDTSYIVVSVLGLVITAIGLIFAPSVLKLLQTPEVAFDDAVSFLRVLFLGTSFILFYNTLSFALRGVGDSVTSLIFLIISMVINTFLDLLFVVSFGWGSTGAALATVVSQGLIAVLLVIYTGRLEWTYLHFKLHRMRFHWQACKDIIKIGLPSGLQQAAVYLSVLVVARLANSHGAAVAAAFSTIPRIDAFIMLPGLALGMTTSNFVAQNLGAGQLERVAKGLRIINVMTFLISLSVSLLVIAFRYQLMELFIPATDVDVIEAGANYFMIAGWFYPVFGLILVYISAIRGLGRPMIVLIITFISLIGFRGVLGTVFNNIWGINGVWFAFTATWAISVMAYFVVWQILYRKYLAAQKATKANLSS